MSSGDDHHMHTDDREIQRNGQVEFALSKIINLAISDSTADSFTNENNLPPLPPEMMQALYSEDASIQLKVTQKVRQLLSNMQFEPIHQVIKSGAVPRFVAFLEDTRHPELQLESAWLLIDIALGTPTQTQAVIDAGAIPVLIRLLSSPNEKIIELSVRTLGNIVFDSTSRDLVLNSNVLPPLLGLFNNETLSTSTMRTATWALRILCWGQNPRPNFEQVSPCLPVLSRQIRRQDSTVLSHACWALSSLCGSPIEQIQVVINSGVCPHAVQLLSHIANEVVSGALVLVGNIAMGTDSQVQVLIDAHVLPALDRLLSHERASIVKEASCTLSNITARREKAIQAVIDPNISSLIGAIAPLCKLLSETNAYLTKFALSGLVNILRNGKSIANKANSTVNPYATLSCNSPSMKLALNSDGAAIQLDATKSFGKFLGTSDGFNLIIDEVIRSGAVPRFVHFLEDSRYPELQFESAWVLTNIAAGTSAQSQVVIDAGAVPVLIKLLATSSNESVVEQSVWTLGNIACDSTEYRDLLLNSNVLPPLLELFNNDNLNTSTVRTATWTLSCLCKNPIPNFEQVSPCLPLLARLMVNEDDEVLVNVCQALSSFCDAPKEQIQVVIESDVCPRAVQLLSHTSNEVVAEALFLICNINQSTNQYLY